MRLSSTFALCFLAVACGGTINNSDGGTNTDAGSSDVSTTKDSSSDVITPPFDAGSFCSGTTPKLQINGSDSTILKATGKAIILNCCQSAEISLATAQFQAMMNIMWRTPALSGAATIDLANPPQGFGVEMDLGCDPATQSCANASPEERYFNEGFSGTIQYATGNNAMSVSYCLQITESPSQPHAVIHSMALYAPNIDSP